MPESAVTTVNVPNLGAGAVPAQNTPPTEVKSPATETKPLQEEKKPEVSSQFAALAKKEKMIYQKAKEIADKEKFIKDMESKVNAEKSKFEKLRSEAKIKPLDAMKELGLEYKDVTDFILNQEKPTLDAKLQQVQDELRRMKEDQDAAQKRLAEQAAKDAEDNNAKVIANFKSSIRDFVDAKKEEFDVIAAFGFHDLVYQGIEQTAQATGRIPTIAEAAKGVQNYLIETMDKVLPTLKWFKEKYVPKAPEPEKKVVEGPEGSKVTQTLSNDLGAGSTTIAKTEAERMARALAALESA